MKTLIVRSATLVAWLGFNTINVLAGAVDIVTGYRTDLRRRYKDTLISIFGLNEEES